MDIEVLGGKLSGVRIEVGTEVMMLSPRTAVSCGEELRALCQELRKIRGQNETTVCPVIEQGRTSKTENIGLVSRMLSSHAQSPNSVGSEVHVILDYIMSSRYRETNHSLPRPKVQGWAGV